MPQQERLVVAVELRPRQPSERAYERARSFPFPLSAVAAEEEDDEGLGPEPEASPSQWKPLSALPSSPLLPSSKNSSIGGRPPAQPVATDARNFSSPSVPEAKSSGAGFSAEAAEEERRAEAEMVAAVFLFLFCFLNRIKEERRG